MALAIMGQVSSVDPDPTSQTTLAPKSESAILAPALPQFLVDEMNRMKQRRYQSPNPYQKGHSWVIRPRVNVFEAGKSPRYEKITVRLADFATTTFRKACKLRDEHMRNINQGLESPSSATNFKYYVDTVYRGRELKNMRKAGKSRYEGVITNYLFPAFEKLNLGDLTAQLLQGYFSSMADSRLEHESIKKIRSALSSILNSAVKYGYLAKNQARGLALPASKKGKRTIKQIVTPHMLDLLLDWIAEPYATMVYVAIYTGLRISELVALKWNDIHGGAISVSLTAERQQEIEELHGCSVTIDETFCRGEWNAPKSASSNTTIAINPCVVARIEKMKTMTVEVRAGHAVRKYKVVKSDGPEDLVFQGVYKGRAINDNNVQRRHIKPAATKLGWDFVNWRCLRTSHATWLKLSGADPKDAQGQLRHSRVGTTLDIYQQFVPESQHRVVAKLSDLSKRVQ